MKILRNSKTGTTELPVLKHFVDGQHTDRLSKDTLAVRNPATGETMGHIPMGTRELVSEAVEAALTAFPQWSRKTPSERADLLLEVAGIIDARRQEFERLESLNCGKPSHVAEDDVASAIDTLKFMAGAGRTGMTIPVGDYVTDTTSMIVREPLGVIGLITPWNYPLLMAIWKIAPSLMMGNTVVLKPSEVTPLTALKLAEVISEVLPPGVLNIVLGSGSEVGDALASHPEISMIALTGSVRAGKSVASAAAPNITRVHLELGGKAPAVVFADADLKDAAATIAEAGLWNTGQECGAACRVLVQENVTKEFVDLLAQEISAYVLAEPGAGDDQSLGPLIYEEHLDKVQDMIDKARDQGAEIVLGGKGSNERGFWFEPTLLTAPTGIDITKEEVFGPVITVETFENEVEAVSRANEVDYGLIGSVFTNDLNRAWRISKSLNFGSVNVNTHLALPTEMPWSGFKHSGYGRDLSAYALDDYSRTKHVAIKYQSQPENGLK